MLFATRSAPRYDRLVRCGAAVVLLTVAACGASSTVESGSTCGGADPVQLLGPSPLIPTPSEVEATIAGDRVVAFVSGRDAVNDSIEQIFAVDRCGTHPIELVAGNATPRVFFGAAGPWVVAVEEGTRRMRWGAARKAPAAEGSVAAAK